MVKRLQNKIAGSRFALPVTAVYSIMIWLAGGLIANQLYLHFLLFGLSAYLMVELNNSNSLIRIYSRMVPVRLWHLRSCLLFFSIPQTCGSSSFVLLPHILFCSNAIRTSARKAWCSMHFSSSALPASFSFRYYTSYHSYG